ncbi:MAG: hypothetical protein QOF22_1809, partial [Bradyrhizobium sp.]|nr:hypothetical protein [Bradyrhizobium sp.]
PFWVLLTIKLMEMSKADKLSRLPHGPQPTLARSS